MKRKNGSRDEQRSHACQDAINKVMVPGVGFAPLQRRNVFNGTHSRATFPIQLHQQGKDTQHVGSAVQVRVAFPSLVECMSEKVNKRSGYQATCSRSAQEKSHAPE